MSRDGLRERVVRRSLFGVLGAYLGGLAGLILGIPSGYGAVVLAALFAVAGAVALAAESRLIRRVAVVVGMVMPSTFLYLALTLSAFGVAL